MESTVLAVIRTNKKNVFKERGWGGRNPHGYDLRKRCMSIIMSEVACEMRYTL